MCFVGRKEACWCSVGLIKNNFLMTLGGAIACDGDRAPPLSKTKQKQLFYYGVNAHTPFMMHALSLYEFYVFFFFFFFFKQT